MASLHISRFALLLFLISSRCLSIFAVNVTALLSSFPELSDFNALLSSTAVASDLSRRSSLTLLAVPNSRFPSSDPRYSRSLSSNVADVVRYHVLLEYLSWPDLRLISPSGKLVTTLFQTTGRAAGNLGSVNLTRDAATGAVTVRSTGSYSPSSNATVLSLFDTFPYNLTVFSVDSFLVPYGFDLMASETRPQPPAVNISKTLLDGHSFNVAAAMLAASGVVHEFEADEGGAGITLFVPTDDAFSDLPATIRIPSLPADQKAVVLRFHVLHSYYPLGSLESIVNPVQPTLATEGMGAGRFTLNISRVNGSVAIDTGILQAFVTRTVFDQNPVAIFGVSKVLLPREIFGKNAIAAAKRGNGGISSHARPPDVPSPRYDSPVVRTPPIPPERREEMRSDADKNAVRRGVIVCLHCIVGLYVLVFV